MSNKKINKAEIKRRFNNLFDDSIITPQKRGYEFEKLIEAKLENEGLEPRASYKSIGEQIDGSFFWEGRTFLLEAKWVGHKLPASSIYSFKGKLDGKFHTSSGVFLSLNGYSKDVEDALKFGKTLNIILFDNSDIKLIFNGDVSFLEVLKFKLRAAGDTGSLNIPYELKAEVEKISKSNSQDFANILSFTSKNKKKRRAEDLLIFVEGQSDVNYINNLIKPIELDFLLSYKIIPLEGANNIRQIPSLVNLYAQYGNTKAVLVFLDDDQKTAQLKDIIHSLSEQVENSSIPVQTKFFFVDDNLKAKLRDGYLENLIYTKKKPKPELYKEIESFVNSIAYDYYNPEINIPRDAIKSSLLRADWDFENGEIGFEDDFTGYNITVDNVEDLVEYLNEYVISEVQGTMPLYLLKDNDFLDYDMEIREHLIDYHMDKLKKLKWNTSDL